jgi:hypothetical protein
MQPHKICPQCQTPADLTASSCARCGRVYHTQFAPPVQQTQVFTPFASPPYPMTPDDRFSNVPERIKNMIYVMWAWSVACGFIEFASALKGDKEPPATLAFFSLGALIISLVLLAQPFKWARIHGGIMLALYALGALLLL